MEVTTTTPPFAVIERACSTISLVATPTVMIVTSQFLPLVSSGRIPKAASRVVVQPCVRRSLALVDLRLIGVDGDDRAGARVYGALNGSRANAATSNHRHCVARFHSPRLAADPNPVARPHEMSAAARRSYQGSMRITEPH